MTKFKISKYNQNCYGCHKGRAKSVLIKFNVELSALGVGMHDTYMECVFCKRKAYSVVNTWWNGAFKDTEIIYEDTAKRKKIKISDIPDYTDILAKQHCSDLSSEITASKKDLENKLLKLKKLKVFIENNTEEKNTKGKAKNGQRKKGR